MKITKRQLKRIIKEEIDSVFTEGYTPAREMGPFEVHIEKGSGYPSVYGPYDSEEDAKQSENLLRALPTAKDDIVKGRIGRIKMKGDRRPLKLARVWNQDGEVKFDWAFEVSRPAKSQGKKRPRVASSGHSIIDRSKWL